MFVSSPVQRTAFALGIIELLGKNKERGGSVLKVQPVTYHGYRFSRKLPCILIKIEYAYDNKVNIENIDEWFSKYLDFKIDPSFFSDPLDREAKAVEKQAVSVIYRALTLYRDFLTCSGIPCYEPGLVVRVDPVAGKANAVNVSFTLQVLDNFSFKAFADLFNGALAMVRGPMSRATEPAAAEELLQQVKKETLQTFSDSVPFNLGQQSILGLAFKHGIPFRHIGWGIVKLGWGSKARLLQYSRSDADSAIANEVCHDKFMTSRLLRSAGLPGAEHLLARNAEEVVEAAKTMGWPVVVKPPDRERSEGITTNITDNAKLMAAYETAGKYGSTVLVERHVAGDCHRILIANERLIYVVRRVPKGFKGDGKRSVSEFAGDLNKRRLKQPPWRRWKEWPLDDETDQVLADQGLTRESVPEEGRRVLLRAIQSSEWGGDIEDLTEQIHPDNVRLAVAATKLMGMSISGVDLMTTDISRPWHETGSIINEMNFMPEFNWMDREEAASSAIPALLSGDGRIPVHLLVGQANQLGGARFLKDRIAMAGGKCHLTTAHYSEEVDGTEIHMPGANVFERSMALLLRPDVDELVIAGTEQELFQHGFPVDRFETATVMHSEEDYARQVLGILQAHVAVGTFRRMDPIA